MASSLDPQGKELFWDFTQKLWVYSDGTVYPDQQYITTGTPQEQEEEMITDTCPYTDEQLFWDGEFWRYSRDNRIFEDQEIISAGVPSEELEWNYDFTLDFEEE